MQPIIDKKMFHLIGIERQIDLGINDFEQKASEAKAALREVLPQISKAAQPTKFVVYWFSKLRSFDAEVFVYCGLETDYSGVLPAGCILMELPESLYARFRETRRGTIGGPDGYGYKEWLPSSAYSLNDAIPGDFEVYDNIERSGPDDECDIMIPIQPRI